MQARAAGRRRSGTAFGCEGDMIEVVTADLVLMYGKCIY